MDLDVQPYLVSTIMTLNYLSTNLRENMEGIHIFSDQMLMYILIFGLTYCICSMRISLYCMYLV